jgi:hypothetical protein
MNLRFLPRPLGGLQPNILCNIYGWGDVEATPRHDLVTVRGSHFCDPTSSEVFCSIFNTTEHETCSAVLGSPIICRNEIAGLVTNNESCTTNDKGQGVLNYQTVGGTEEWIEDVTYYSIIENTVRFIVNVAHYTFPDLDTAVTRCAASIITNVHVLTTATCVNVQLPLSIAIQATTSTENTNNTGEILIAGKFDLSSK